VNSVELIFPKGFQTASSLKQHKTSNGLDKDSEILSINYFDGEARNIAVVDCKINNKTSNFAIASGAPILEANSITLKETNF
jgi:hypothetical protein